MRRAAFALLLAVALAVGAAGCKKKPATSAKEDEALFRNIALTQQRADSVFNMRDTLKVDRGHWNEPGSTTQYEAYRDRDIYRFIEERRDFGDHGSTDNRYYYDPAGTLFYYEDRGEEKEPRGAMPPMSRLVQRSLIFAPDGRSTWGRVLVDGVARVAPDSQSVLIADRSRALVAKVKGMVP